MHKCSSQPRPERWKTSGDHSRLGSHKVTKKKKEKKREREADAEPQQAAVGLVSDGRWRAKFTLVTTTAETQNRGRERGANVGQEQAG